MRKGGVRKRGRSAEHRMGGGGGGAEEAHRYRIMRLDRSRSATVMLNSGRVA